MSSPHLRQGDKAEISRREYPVLIGGPAAVRLSLQSKFLHLYLISSTLDWLYFIKIFFYHCLCDTKNRCNETDVLSLVALLQAEIPAETGQVTGYCRQCLSLGARKTPYTQSIGTSQSSHTDLGNMRDSGILAYCLFSYEASFPLLLNFQVSLCLVDILQA